MPIDASIYGQIQQPQQQNPLNALAQAMQIRGAQYQIDKASRDDARQNKLLSVLQSPEFQQGDTATRARLAYGAGDVEAASKITTAAAAANKDQRAADVSGLEMKLKQLDAAANIAGSVTDQASYDRALPLMQSLGFDTSKFSPQYNPDGVRQFAMATLSAKDKLANQTQIRGQDITRQNNIDTNATSASNNANTVAVQRDRLAFDKDQPKGQVVQTDSGTMLVDPRTGEARPVTSGGVPVQKPGKEIPASVNKSIMENQQNISKIDRALAAIDAKPSALGPQYMIPGAETIGQYVDPEGVNARAGVADIGSMILHDRSGAAVTVSEMPRLKPFIPTASDKPEVAKQKLARFRQEYEAEAGLLAQTYGKDQGYKESPLLKSGADKPAAATPAKTKVVGGKTYAFDGKGWYVAE